MLCMCVYTDRYIEVYMYYIGLSLCKVIYKHVRAYMWMCCMCVCLYRQVEVYICVLIGMQKLIYACMRLYRLSLYVLFRGELECMCS